MSKKYSYVNIPDKYIIHDYEDNLSKSNGMCNNLLQSSSLLDIEWRFSHIRKELLLNRCRPLVTCFFGVIQGPLVRLAYTIKYVIIIMAEAEGSI